MKVHSLCRDSETPADEKIYRSRLNQSDGAASGGLGRGEGGGGEGREGLQAEICPERGAGTEGAGNGKTRPCGKIQL